jgi:hypothetical protein
VTPRFPAAFALLVTVVVGLAPGARAAAADTIAWLPLTGTGVSADEIAVLDAELRAALAALPGVTVPPAQVVADAIEAGAALQGRCSLEERACRARTGRLVNADLVASGVVGAAAEGYTVSLRLLAVKTSEEKETPLLLIPRTPVDERDLAERLAVTRLARPEREVGVVVVQVLQTGALVSVDGGPPRPTPLPPLELKPGHHELGVELKGYEPQTHELDLAFGETQSVRFELQRKATTEIVGPSDAPVDDDAQADDGAPDEPAARAGGASGLVEVYVRKNKLDDDDDVEETLLEVLATGASKQPGVHVVTSSDLKNMIDTTKCLTDDCIQDSAEVLQADLYVDSVISKFGNTLRVTLKVYPKDKPLQIATESLRGTPEQILDAAPVAVRALIRKARPELPPTTEIDRESRSLPLFPVVLVSTGGLFVLAGSAVAVSSFVFGANTGIEPRTLAVIGGLGAVGAGVGAAAAGFGAWLWATAE